MQRFYKVAVILLAILLTFAVGCKKNDQPQDDIPEVSQDAPEMNTQQTEPVVEDPGTDPAPEIKIDTDPQFDGVYKNEKGSVIIRSAVDEMCDFIISIGDDGADGYLSGVAQISGNEVIYETEIYGFTMVLSFDDLVLEETGNNTYSEVGFAGSYSRSEDDPYSVEVRQSFGSDELPDTLSSTVIYGMEAVLYVDPENRFTATVPDIFSGAPEDDQPASGVHLTSVDGDVDALIEAINSDSISDDELKALLESEFSAEADMLVDGTVVLETSSEVDNASFITVVFAHVIDGGVARVQYRFDVAQEEYFRPLLDQVSMNIN